MNIRPGLLTTAAVVVLASACSSGASAHHDDHVAPMPATESAVATDRISISDFRFGPDDAAVAPGATVTVTNNDTTAHTATDPGKFDTGTIAPHASATFTAPTTPGTYDYFCSIHTYMHGTLTVR